MTRRHGQYPKSPGSGSMVFPLLVEGLVFACGPEVSFDDGLMLECALVDRVVGDCRHGWQRVLGGRALSSLLEAGSCRLVVQPRGLGGSH